VYKSLFSQKDKKSRGVPGNRNEFDKVFHSYHKNIPSDLFIHFIPWSDLGFENGTCQSQGKGDFELNSWLKVVQLSL
jgi:hypothetical protein